MPKMRCLHCGRWVLVDHSQNVNEARCICGTFVMSSFQVNTVPELILDETKPKKVISLGPKLKAKQAVKPQMQTNDDLEECAA